MKTDAYTECRGVGRISRNDRATINLGQVNEAATLGKNFNPVAALVFGAVEGAVGAGDGVFK